jgi:type I restriction enzyme, S subunit
VANAEKNLGNARGVFESYLNAIFTGDREGWKEVRLGEVFNTVTGNTPSKKNAELYGDYLPFVKPPELRDDVVESAADSLSQLGAEVARSLRPTPCWSLVSATSVRLLFLPLP